MQFIRAFQTYWIVTKVSKIDFDIKILEGHCGTISANVYFLNQVPFQNSSVGNVALPFLYNLLANFKSNSKFAANT